MEKRERFPIRNGPRGCQPERIEEILRWVFAQLENQYEKEQGGRSRAGDHSGGAKGRDEVAIEVSRIKV